MSDPAAIPTLRHRSVTPYFRAVGVTQNFHPLYLTFFSPLTTVTTTSKVSIRFSRGALHDINFHLQFNGEKFVFEKNGCLNCLICNLYNSRQGLNGKWGEV
jgi:hypothetical protein